MRALTAVLGAGVLLLGFAPAASALSQSPMGGSAHDTVEWLRDEGYHVQLNGRPGQGSLSQCTATGVHGLRSSNVDDDHRRIDGSAFDTVYVDVSCNDTV